MDWEDVQPRKTASGSIGENLENFSVAELEARLAELEAEITRVRNERDRKKGLSAAAAEVFKS